MTADQLLESIRAAGRTVSAKGANIAVSNGPPLSDRERMLLIQMKPQLLLILQPERPLGTLPGTESLGWERMRELAANLGLQVAVGTRHYQLWGITPRGALCFDGKVIRTVDHEEVKSP